MQDQGESLVSTSEFVVGSGSPMVPLVLVRASDVGNPARALAIAIPFHVANDNVPVTFTTQNGRRRDRRPR